jgi:acetyl esterase/lipase
MAGKGYTVISMNYETAPEARYPAPIVQIGEVYAFVKAMAMSGKYPTVNPDRIIIGGDSAGAQMASQFVAVQTNPELASRMGIDAVVPPQALLATLLYCGPYNVKQLANVRGIIHRFFMNMIGWAYIGEQSWRESSQALQASTIDHVTRQFPPAFITDGNVGSFERHGQALADKLSALNVPVCTLFFPQTEGPVQHEYQFQLNTPQALQCLDRTLAFLAEHLGE